MEPFFTSFNAEERHKIEEAIRTACITQQQVVTKRVEDQGLLQVRFFEIFCYPRFLFQSLGDIEGLKPEQRKALEELKDVFQHMSYPYLHVSAQKLSGSHNISARE